MKATTHGIKIKIIRLAHFYIETGSEMTVWAIAHKA